MKNLLKSAFLVATLAAGTTLAHAGGITYTCAADVATYAPAGFCASLNSVVAADYNSIFSNANASIYVQFDPNTGLGDSTAGFENFITYGQYVAALASSNSGDPEDASIQMAGNLPNLNPNSQVEITSALGAALGLSADVVGITAPTDNTSASGGSIACTIGTSGCYNGILELVTPQGLLNETGNQSLYYPGLSADPQTSTQYNVFSVVEHETDEILGTASCNNVGDGSVVSNGCYGAESAVDLFRYNNGSFVPDSADSNAPGAYFSSNGGATAGAPLYNTNVPNNDYADYLNTDSNGVACGYVQSMQGCLGASATQDIKTDGGSEVRILDAVGYNLNTTAVPSATPEPTSLALLGTGIAAIGGIVRRRRRTV